MKAIVLTYPEITEDEKELLKNTEVFKIACNGHAKELKPDIRLIVDKGIYKKILADCPERIATRNEYDKNEPRLEDCRFLPNRNSTVPACVDYLVYKGFRYILLIANNKVTSDKAIAEDFQNYNRKTINELTKVAHIFKYSPDGVFDVPYLSIKEFLEMDEINLTEEEKIMGLTEPKKKTLLEVLAFSESYLYEVKTKGLENASIENGVIIGSILSSNEKAKILNGVETIEYQGMIIKRLTDAKEKTDTDTKSLEELKAQADELGIEYAKNIGAVTLQKRINEKIGI